MMAHSLSTVVLLAGLLLVLFSGGAEGSGEVFKGQARVVDGDTLYIGRDKFRFFGVDAPEKAQLCRNSRGQTYECGTATFNALAAHVGKRMVQCEVKNKDQYGRNVAVCYIVEGPLKEDLGMWLVSNGLAVAYRAYSKNYVAAEQQARAARLGIWQGTFTMPSVWRKQHRGNMKKKAP